MPRQAWYAVGLLALLALGVGVAVVARPPAPSPSPSPPAGIATPPPGDTASGGQGDDVDGVKCQSHEQFGIHVHAHLSILLDGQPVPVSALIGIPGGEVGVPRCFYWLHTHDSSGIIHIEAPGGGAPFTLGQFFDVWGQPLGRNGVATYPVPDGDLTTLVDGQPFDGDPRDVPLSAHTQVVLMLGRQVPPPPPFVFPAGL